MFGEATTIFQTLIEKSQHIVHIETEKDIMTTYGADILRIHHGKINLAQCNHKETNTRMLLHAADAVGKRF